MCFPALLAAIPALASAGGAGAAAGAAAAATAAGTISGGAIAAAGGAAAASAAAASAGAAAAGVLGTGLSAVELAGLVGSVLSAGSTIAQGVAQQQQAKTQQKIVDRDAAIQAIDVNQRQQDVIRRRRIIAGQQNTIAAKQGRTFSGSVLDVVQQSNVTSELDILSAQYGGQIASQNARTNKSILQQQGRAALTKGIFGAGTTLATAGIGLL